MAASLIVNTLEKSVLNPDNIVKRRAVRNYTNVNIDRISYLVTNNSYSNFFETFLLRNQPCILSSVNTEAWKSRKDWVNSDGKPNFEFLRKTFGTYFLSLSLSDRLYTSAYLFVLKVMIYNYFIGHKFHKFLRSGHTKIGG